MGPLVLRRRILGAVVLGAGLLSALAFALGAWAYSRGQLLLPLLAAVLVVMAITLLISQHIARNLSSTHAQLILRAQALIERLAPGERHATPRPAVLPEALDALAGQITHTLGTLEDERDWLESILQTGMEGVLVTDASGRIILANDPLRALMPAQGDLLGKLPIEAIRNDDLAELLARVQRAGEASTQEIDLGGLNVRHLRVHAAPLRSARGGVVAILYDVTDLRRLETLRRDFVANVSHELRTPIAAIRVAVETLESGALEDPLIAADFVGIISRHAQRLHALVEDLLDLSRLDARRMELALQPLRVTDLFSSLRKLHTLAAERKPMELVLEMPEEPLLVRADRRGVEQILGNFIDNALKYCRPHDRITLRATVLDSTRLRLSVHDSGPGIAANHLPRLFERFYRVHRGRSRDLGGTGLGLAIAKHLAEAMGGAVHVESELGEGSTFSVDLRRATEENLLALESTAPSEPSIEVPPIAAAS